MISQKGYYACRILELSKHENLFYLVVSVVDVLQVAGETRPTKGGCTD